MKRFRLASLALAGSLVLVSGCLHFDWCWQWRPFRRHCPCNETGAYRMEGPTLIAPDTTPVAPPPRIVPVPQANPTAAPPG